MPPAGLERPRRPAECQPFGWRMTAMLIAGQCTPHFLFGLAEKKTGRARSKRKERFLSRSGTYVPPRCTGVDVRWCLRVCEDRPTGAAGYRRDLAVDSRGAGADETRGAGTHLISTSFRAFRFATRSLGGRGGLCFRADESIGPYNLACRPLKGRHTG